MNAAQSFRRIAYVLVGVPLFFFAVSLIPEEGEAETVPAPRTVIQGETYRLVHAIGNTERVNARDLGRSDCEQRRDEYRIIVASLGTGGSVTCQPESTFSD